MLPKLDLVLQTYVAGLAGGGNIASGFGKQWSDGRPGYTAGLRFDVPLGNRAAKARLERQTLELNRTALLFQTTVETGLTEVELAVRESETAYREMAGRYQSLLAAEIETSFLTERWRWLPGDDRSTAQLLEDLLESQERLATAEAELVTAEAAYVVGMTRVRKAMGTLLQAEYLPFEMEGTPVTTPAHERR
jgi:outer membrane protein TolC